MAAPEAGQRHPELPEEITSPVQAASLTPGTRVLDQPRHPRPPGRVGSWWDYTGPLLLVFNGGPASRAGELVLPVRLPQGAGGPRLELPAALGMALTPESRTAYDEHLFAEATPSIPAANDATTPWCRVR